MEEMARELFLHILATSSHVLTNSVFLHAWILSKIELVRRRILKIADGFKAAVACGGREDF